MRTHSQEGEEVVKARQLILELNNNTKSGAVALQGRPNPEEEVELNVATVVREKEVPMVKKLQTFAVIPLLRYIKFEKYAGTTNNVSYMELVRNRTRTKVATTSAANER
ncbi:hypothetical protein AXG93_4259s1060 [Marchantia polymorpha subsp. ruderalis]|uniref:Uncharacterized protein n=1 Tax=Marchantia polymorpha subsp. ruderalis TaxID=1480154 RepID=A0A176WUD5_MARPO|nr:hypothetical protein AXG93_4259s1060 [Marchantia polymorpha subsp. ruderalis]